MPPWSPDPNRTPNPVDRQVGVALRNLRLAHAMSQAELAERIGVEVAEIDGYEQGRLRIDARRLIELAHLFHTPVSSFWVGIRGPGPRAP